MRRRARARTCNPTSGRKNKQINKSKNKNKTRPGTAPERAGACGACTLALLLHVLECARLQLEQPGAQSETSGQFSV